MMTLVDLLANHDGSVEVLKIDAEGWDVRILRAALSLFRERRVKKVYWETAPWNRAADPAQGDLIRQLVQYGYVPIERPGLDMAFELRDAPVEG
jgi:hypothetical protein